MHGDYIVFYKLGTMAAVNLVAQSEESHVKGELNMLLSFVRETYGW